MSDLIEMLNRLDMEGVEVWKNRNRWFWARTTALKLHAPKTSEDKIPDLGFIHGPFDRSIEAVRNAFESVRV